MVTIAPPDLVLVAPEWPTRALLRAQLLEEGFEVVATDTWADARRYLRPGIGPRVVIVDLHGLPELHRVLAELRLECPADRVLIVTALGTLTGDEARRLGFHVVARPASVGEIVAATAALCRARPAPARRPRS